jgi:glucosamine kinase
VQSLEAIATALDPEGVLPLAVCGSIGRRLEPRFAATVRTRCVAPVGDSIDGALRLIRQALGAAGS